ncbi:glycosyltransferase family 2 protein [Dactylosporangium sp. CA-139066]|uniref:glycosyltransferase family 2 protein n=1 Tax=Dactylosporangium sp. CA-139066 TaxID=3239930 RepID=UPI003D93AF58
MIDLVTVVPTRDRPQTAHELVEAFTATCTADTLLAIVVDDSDPSGARYAEPLGLEVVSAVHAPAGAWDAFRERTYGVFSTPSRTMVEALNLAATAMLEHVNPFAIGFMGDDHRPRTPGWDRRYVDELRDLGSGIVYGDDLLQGQKLPTQAAMSADIVRELGYMAPPKLVHLYVDNFWRDLGTRAGCLRYVPDAVVEHLHPLAGKGNVDEGYRRVNAPAVYNADEVTYKAYQAEHFAADVERVRALREVRV